MAMSAALLEPDDVGYTTRPFVSSTARR